MKKIIHKYDYENGIITVIYFNRYLNLYLTNSIKKRFSDLLEVGYYIHFKANYDIIKIINKKKCYQINHFLKIEKRTHKVKKTVYDLKALRENVVNKITKDNYYLFLDLEMTMPPYYHVNNFQAEIIQVGYYLTNNKCKIIKKNDYYLKPTKFKTISKRTLKFLDLKRDAIKNPKNYSYFYKDLYKLMKKYNPKIVVWGKNDYLAIKNSFIINKEKPIIHQNSFINLLTKVKQYYNLFNDIGLFNAYEIYYNEAPLQKHDALSDAYVLYKIYEAVTKKIDKESSFLKQE